MKTPTKKELQALAVRALGEGAKVSMYGRKPVVMHAEYRSGMSPSVRVVMNDARRAEAALAAALRALEADVCGWTADDDGNWHTGCERMFVLEAGTPKGNEMAWCCYCGRALAGED